MERRKSPFGNISTGIFPKTMHVHVNFFCGMKRILLFRYAKLRVGESTPRSEKITTHVIKENLRIFLLNFQLFPGSYQTKMEGVGVMSIGLTSKKFVLKCSL